MNPEEIMRAAIAEAEKSQTPYGAVIVKDNQIIERAGNTVKPHSDPTAHAEVNAIRKLTTRLNQASVDSGYILYSTCEPCPMCAATCVWAGISEIVYGVGVDDFANENPNVIDLRCQDVIAQAPSSISIKSGVLKQDCKQLHSVYSP